MRGVVATRSEPQTIDTDVLVAGGGPCGLMLANELGRRGVRCLVVDAKPGTALNPQANREGREIHQSNGKRVLGNILVTEAVA